MYDLKIYAYIYMYTNFKDIYTKRLMYDLMGWDDDDETKR